MQGLSGQPFSGPDIGGFVGDATPKLFVRWIGVGAMMPFARGHSEKGTIDQEPWSFGPEVLLDCNLFILTLELLNQKNNSLNIASILQLTIFYICCT